MEDFSKTKGFVGSEEMWRLAREAEEEGKGLGGGDLGDRKGRVSEEDRLRGLVVDLEGRVRDRDDEIERLEEEVEELKGRVVVVEGGEESLVGRKKGAVAYEMRASGVGWDEIGRVVGSRNALMCAKAWAEGNGKDWPIEVGVGK